MGAMASQITSLTIVYSTVYSGADQKIYGSSASVAFVRGVHRWPHKWPLTRKRFPFDDVIVAYEFCDVFRFSIYRKWNMLLSVQWGNGCLILKYLSSYICVCPCVITDDLAIYHYLGDTETDWPTGERTNIPADKYTLGWVEWSFSLERVFLPEKKRN